LLGGNTVADRYLIDADLLPRYVRGDLRPGGFRVTKDEMTGTRVRAFACKIAALLIATATAGLFSALAAPAASAATPTPQRLGYCGGDDWEPAMAADSGHVYVLITHYSGDTSCDPAAGQNNSRIMIQVSSDGGRTFAPPAVVAPAPGGIAYPSQADPAIAVDKATGAVYVSFLAFGLSGGHTDIYVAKSTDHGSRLRRGRRARRPGQRLVRLGRLLNQQLHRFPGR